MYRIGKEEIDVVTRVIQSKKIFKYKFPMQYGCVLRFGSEEEARRFVTSDNVNGWLPINTGKHVYFNWTPILEKRGAFHPAMDPFKMPSHNLNHNDTLDMCPKT